MAKPQLTIEDQLKIEGYDRGITLFQIISTGGAALAGTCSVFTKKQYNLVTKKKEESVIQSSQLENEASYTSETPYQPKLVANDQVAVGLLLTLTGIGIFGAIMGTIFIHEAYKLKKEILAGYENKRMESYKS